MSTGFQKELEGRWQGPGPAEPLPVLPTCRQGSKLEQRVEVPGENPNEPGSQDLTGSESS